MFSKGNLPQGDWRRYIKRVSTNMLRIDGPFEVQTVHQGVVQCEDGFLAIDSNGFPYPVSADEHARSYVDIGEAKDMK